ncbi:MAG: hypothetical protein V4496_05740 [Pseudomonadota bacterium]
MKVRVNQSIGLSQLLRFISAATVLYFFTILAHAEEVTLLNDGSIGTQPVDIKHFQNLSELLNIIPEVQQNEPVDMTACHIKIPESHGKNSFESKHRFTIFSSKPTLLMANLIENVPIFFSGKATKKTKQTQVAMLKKVLPAVGNQQLLARVLANPKFKFVIDYSHGLHKTLNLPNAAAATQPSPMLIILTPALFLDETYLLQLLRNEFASMNAMIANDCLLGYYDTTIGNRASPFALYWTPEKFPKVTLNEKEVNMKMDLFLYRMKDAYQKLINEKDLISSMQKGTKKTTEWYKKFEAYLMAYIPTSTKYRFENDFFDNSALVRSTRSKTGNNLFDTKYITSASGKSAHYHFFHNSEKHYSDHVTLLGFPCDPHDLSKKIILFYDNLVAHYEMTMGSTAPEYASKNELNRYAEWFSYLEQDYSGDFLKFLFPAYCDYMTEYTQQHMENLAEKKRNYCSF